MESAGRVGWQAKDGQQRVRLCASNLSKYSRKRIMHNRELFLSPPE